MGEDRIRSQRLCGEKVIRLKFPGLDTWRHMTGRIAGLGTELDGIIWEARLAALLSSI